MTTKSARHKKMVMGSRRRMLSVAWIKFPTNLCLRWMEWWKCGTRRGRQETEWTELTGRSWLCSAIADLRMKAWRRSWLLFIVKIPTDPPSERNKRREEETTCAVQSLWLPCATVSETLDWETRTGDGFRCSSVMGTRTHAIAGLPLLARPPMALEQRHWDWVASNHHRFCWLCVSPTPPYPVKGMQELVMLKKLCNVYDIINVALEEERRYLL